MSGEMFSGSQVLAIYGGRGAVSPVQCSVRESDLRTVRQRTQRSAFVPNRSLKGHKIGSMETSIATDVENDPISKDLISYLQDNAAVLSLQDGRLYYNFPLYRDEEEGGLLSTKVLVASPRHGVIVWGASSATANNPEFVRSESDAVDHVFSHVYSRLLKNKRLRKSRQELTTSLSSGVYAPNLSGALAAWESETRLLTNTRQVASFFQEIERETEQLSPDIFNELLSTLEGAKGLIRPQKRDLALLQDTSKGYMAAALEAEIATFDREQKQGSITVLDGPQRVRGLAGSGKTIVLAMKAALTHLRNPDARILYTFHTKSLYQHVRRLITRFYRQFDDRDPDWSRLHVMHAWGGPTLPGVYYSACQAHGIAAKSFAEAMAVNRDSPFGYACEHLIRSVSIKRMYDCIFIDEGQDFPLSFTRLCAQLAENEQFVIAYDELQSIFQTQVPSAIDVFGVDEHGDALRDFSEVVLHKCYRNPREILVCAHALGFGIYGSKIVQMLENKDHWEDIGYRVVAGDFTAGSMTKIERPAEHSPSSISSKSTLDDIINAIAFSGTTASTEVGWVASQIAENLKDGLRPDDILVVCVDDRNVKHYFSALTEALVSQGIPVRNVHAAAFGDNEFQEDGHVTLSTVHKAKGNEGFMVYVIGVDALYPSPNVRERNMLFTAMTRAKGWVRVSGVGENAKMCVQELSRAKEKLPCLEFAYPSETDLKIMKRDLEESASRRLRVQRLLDELEAEGLSREELEEYRKQLDKSLKKRPSKRMA